MKKNYLYILGEQILVASIFFFLIKYSERFYSTNVVVGLAFMNLGLLLSRLTFLLAEKYKEKYRKSTAIIKLLMVATIMSFSTVALAYFTKEAISIKTFCAIVCIYVIYIYITRSMALKFQDNLEETDTDVEEEPTIEDIIEDLSIKYQLLLLKEHKKVEKRRNEKHLFCDSNLEKEGTELELQMILKLLNYIDLCADEFKNDISSKSTENAERNVSTTEQ